MEMILIIVSGVAIVGAAIYLFTSFKKENEEYEDDFRDNNNFENDTAQDFRPSYNNNEDYGYGYENENSFDYSKIFIWIIGGGIMIFSLWLEYADDDDYYDDGYRSGGYYGTTYYGSSRRYSGYSSGVRRGSRSFRGRSYGGGGK